MAARYALPSMSPLDMHNINAEEVPPCLEHCSYIIYDALVNSYVSWFCNVTMGWAIRQVNLNII